MAFLMWADNVLCWCMFPNKSAIKLAQNSVHNIPGVFLGWEVQPWQQPVAVYQDLF